MLRLQVEACNLWPDLSMRIGWYLLAGHLLNVLLLNLKMKGLCSIGPRGLYIIMHVSHVTPSYALFALMYIVIDGFRTCASCGLMLWIPNSLLVHIVHPTPPTDTQQQHIGHLIPVLMTVLFDPPVNRPVWRSAGTLWTLQYSATLRYFKRFVTFCPAVLWDAIRDVGDIAGTWVWHLRQSLAWLARVSSRSFGDSLGMLGLPLSPWTPDGKVP